MAGTIITDFIRADANKLSLNVGNTIIASVNALGILSNTGNVMISSSGVVDANLSYYGSTSLLSTGRIRTSFQPTGSVLQVVQYNYTGATTVASSSYVALPVTASITPSSASSKILVRVVVHCGMTGSNEGLHGQLWRDGSVVSDARGNAASNRDRAWFHCGAHSSAYEIYGVAAEYLDSPASTSSLTYTVYARGHSASYPILINTNEGDYDSSITSRTVSSITLMEIAG